MWQCTEHCFVPAHLTIEASSASSIYARLHAGSERQYLGVTSVPVPPNYELRKASTHAPAEAATQAPTEPVEGAQGARSAPLGADWRQISGDAAHVDLQMRNLDDADSLHRRVVATLYVDAPLDQVSGLPIL